MNTASAARTGGIARWVVRCLWAAGFLMLAYAGSTWIRSSWSQWQGGRELSRLFSHASPTREVSRPRPGDLVGRVEIPNLGVSAIVFEGTDEKTLVRGVGHMPGSALPGGEGNAVLAAHRDSFFRKLREIRPGDVITVSNASGAHSYEVEWLDIVEPEDVSVIQPTRDAALTLITCYPFEYWGNAPQRFIVRGRPVAPGVDGLTAKR